MRPHQLPGLVVPVPVDGSVPQQHRAVGGEGLLGNRPLRPPDALVLRDGPGGDGQQADLPGRLGQQVHGLRGEKALLRTVPKLRAPVAGLPVPVGEQQRIVQIGGK